MSKKKHKHCDAFKLEAVGMSDPSAQSVAEVATLLGIKPKKLAMWHAQYGHQGDDQYPRNIISRLEEEVSSLHVENKRLRLECVQLKKPPYFQQLPSNQSTAGRRCESADCRGCPAAFFHP